MATNAEVRAYFPGLMALADSAAQQRMAEFDAECDVLVERARREYAEADGRQGFAATGSDGLTRLVLR